MQRLFRENSPAILQEQTEVQCSGRAVRPRLIPHCTCLIYHPHALQKHSQLQGPLRQGWESPGRGCPLRSKKKRVGAATVTACACARVTRAELLIHAFLLWPSSLPRTQSEHVVTTPGDKLKSRQHAWLKAVLPSQGSLASSSTSSSLEVNSFFHF